MSTPIIATDDRAGWVARRLDALPGSPYLWRLVGLVSFGAFFEIYDLALAAPLGVGLKAAGIFRSGDAGLFGLSDQAAFLAATFAGLWVGALGFSTMADRLGRRPIFTVALLWYAVATIVMGLQHDAVAIDAWRFVAGIGVGMELVAIDCYLAELMPARLRGRAFAFSTAIQFLSAPVVAVLAWLLIPDGMLGIAGWRWLALVPGIGAVLVWWVRRALPESPHWLATHGRAEEAEAVLAAMEARVARERGPLPAPRPAPVAAAAPAADPTPPRLWDARLRRTTAVLVVFHLFQTIGYFGFSNWLPTLLVSQGVTISKSLGYSAMLAIIPPAAPLLFLLVADRFERKWLLVTGALVAAGAGLLLSTTTNRSGFLEYALFGGGTSIGLSLMSFAYHAYQSEVFPTAIRARGVGFVYSFSRLSSIFSSLLIAFVLDRGGSSAVFTLIAGSMIVVALVVGLFGPRVRATRPS